MLSPLHPLPKLVVALVWIAASILVFDARFQIAVIAVAVGALILVEGRNAFLVVGLMVPFALFGFGFFTTSVLFRAESGYALQMAGEQGGTRAAASAGLVLFLRAIACGMVSALFVMTTDPGRLVRALMVSWRLPTSVGFGLLMALHLVPDLLDEARQLRLARAMEKGKAPRRIPGPVETVSLIVPLLAYAIRRAGRAAQAMEARGLGARPARTHLDTPRAAQRDAIFVACAGALLGVCVLGLAG